MPSTPADLTPADQPEASPTLPLMHIAFVLAGLGTLLLGPILPLLTARWHLQDAQSGQMLLAQFCGATLGGSTVSSRLQRGLLLGLLCATAGFFAFALAPSLALACAALLLAGFGVGRVIAATNIIAGARYTQHRGSALSWLNFSWSLGALLSPLTAAWLTPHLGLTPVLCLFATLFGGVAAALALQLRQRDGTAEVKAPAPLGSKVATSIYLYFALLLLVYGGLETCLSAWLTTYALRYGQSSLVLSQYTLVLLLCGMTAGRALSGWLLVRMRDATLQRLALALSAGLAAALALAHRASLIATLAVLLGVALAPIFPATFSLLMARHPSARQAGLILAASGLGAAALPWLLGVVSTHTGSLRVALALPVAAALSMLGLSLFTPTPAAPISTQLPRV